ncbi:MAG: ABC transporter ATP-binding protein, partial [Nitrospirae bacterium]|nr:ABC transporter ATP-binding protein [Nitrospirota bacterium]
MEAISVTGLSKVYRIYDKPVDRLKELLLRRPFHREFVALSEVGFSVEEGETMGIIGENGAGKSTLMKILSRTLKPTSGKFQVRGLVSSLLELGSGFHPELTGMENIYFYASLLGVDRATMRGKTEEIANFSEIGDFINYPVKTYSTGMFVRLAFSVATVINPDVLIVDEALSVGDQYFQKKCLDKMREFKEKCKTILFCTHDMYSIKTFCNKVMWLHGGKVKMFGNTDVVVEAYTEHEYEKSASSNSHDDFARHPGSPQSFLFVKNLVV